jgi:hypothetical protein
MELNVGIEGIINPKKKGRPRKMIVEPLEPVEPKIPARRGRKKKEKVIDEEPKIKRKRGRKACVKYFSSSIRKKMPLTTSLQDTDKYILHLDLVENDDNLQKNTTFDTIKDEFLGADNITPLPVQLGKFFENEKKINSSEIEYIIDELSNIDNVETNLIDLYEKRIESRTDEDNLLITKLEKLNTNDNFFNSIINNTETIDTKSTTIKNTEINKCGYFQLYNDFIENESWLHSTKICCWWCCHNFDSVPIGIPVKYNLKTRKFIVKGIFCTFGCMTAYNNLHKVSTKALIKFLYSKLTGCLNVPNKQEYKEYLEKNLNSSIFDNNQEYKDNYISGLIQVSNDNIQEAPPQSALKMFGGELSITDFRNSFKENCIYKMLEYPMCVSRDYIEKVDIQNVKNINVNVFNKINFMKTSTNILDTKKIEETQNRIKNTKTNVITNNSIDRFLSFT